MAGEITVHSDLLCRHRGAMLTWLARGLSAAFANLRDLGACVGPFAVRVWAYGASLGGRRACRPGGGLPSPDHLPPQVRAGPAPTGRRTHTRGKRWRDVGTCRGRVQAAPVAPRLEAGIPGSCWTWRGSKGGVPRRPPQGAWPPPRHLPALSLLALRSLPMALGSSGCRPWAPGSLSAQVSLSELAGGPAPDWQCPWYSIH